MREGRTSVNFLYVRSCHVKPLILYHNVHPHLIQLPSNRLLIHCLIMVNTRATNAQSHPGLFEQTNARAPRRTSAEVAAEKQAEEDRKQAKLDTAARKADRLNEVTAEAKAEDQAYATPVPPRAVVKQKTQPLKRTASVADLAQFEADIREASSMLPPPPAGRQGKKNGAAHPPANTARNTHKAASAQGTYRPTPVPIKSKSSGTPVAGAESGVPAKQSQATAAEHTSTMASKSKVASANPVTLAHTITGAVDSKSNRPKPQKQSAASARTQEDKDVVMAPPGIIHPCDAGLAPKPARIPSAKPPVAEDDSVTESDSPPPEPMIINDESVTESDSQAPACCSPADSDFEPSKPELQPPKKKAMTQLEPLTQPGSKGKTKALMEEVSGKKRVGNGGRREESDEVEIVAESKKKQAAVKKTGVVNKVPPAKDIHQKIFLDKMRVTSDGPNGRYV